MPDSNTAHDEQLKLALAVTLGLKEYETIINVRPVKYQILIEEVTSPAGNRSKYWRTLEVD